VRLYRVAADQYPSISRSPAKHADEVETSLGLAFFPHLVKPELADAGSVKPTRFRGDQSRVGEHHPPVAPGETNTGIGDPRAATAERAAG